MSVSLQPIPPPPEVNVRSMTTASITWLSLYVLRSRLNTRNASGTHLYCNSQPLKIAKLGKINPTKIFHTNYFLRENFPLYSKTMAWIYINPPLYLRVYPEFMFNVFISVTGRKMLVVIVVGEMSFQRKLHI